MLGTSDAAAEVEVALELDPLSPIATSIAALTHLLLTRDYERSAALWRRVEDLDPDFPLLVELWPLTFVALEEWDEARRRLLRIASTATDSAAFSAWTDAAAARRTSLDPDARLRAVSAARLYGERTPHGEIAEALLTGPIDPEAALGILTRIVDVPRYRQAMTWATRLWFFDPLHQDPRFIALRDRLGLSNPSVETAP